MVGLFRNTNAVEENTIKKERGNIAGDSSASSGRISGGVGWKIEFNTPDCQHGWSVIKVGSGQSIGCYLKEEDAKAALEALAVTEPVVKGANPTPTKESTSIWDGVFLPLGQAMSGTNYGEMSGDAGWMSTYNSPPQHDGKPTVGYGNHADPKGRSNQ